MLEFTDHATTDISKPAPDSSMTSASSRYARWLPLRTTAPLSWNKMTRRFSSHDPSDIALASARQSTGADRHKAIV